MPLSNPIFRKISRIAGEQGVRAFVVGGYVRDHYLRRPSTDIDVVVVGSGIALAEALGRELHTKVSSGLQSVGKKSGRKAEYADFFNMHKNYDYIIAGSKSWNKFYCQSFGTTEDKILNYGLPRIDYLIQNEKKNRDKFFAEYPQACGKKVVLYAPTFRRNMESRWFDISKAAGRQNLVIIVKNHPGQHDHYRIDDDNFIYADNWKTLDLLCVCDYLITDYSAIALEAAALNKPTYYWIYDYEEYLSNNGLNIDIKKELGSYAFEDINIIADKISNEKYIYDEYDKYREKYLFNDLGQSTLKICALIISLLGDEIK